MRFPCRKSRQHSHIVTLPPPPLPPAFRSLQGADVWNVT